MQRWYQDALQHEEIEVDCVATLQLRVPLLHHSLRACRLRFQRGGKVEYIPLCMKGQIQVFESVDEPHWKAIAGENNCALLLLE